MGGIGLSRPRLGIVSALGVTFATLVAWLLGFDKSLLQAGVYGYNIIFISLAAAYFLPNNWQVMVTVLLGAVASLLLQSLFVKYDLPAFAVPFVIIAFVIYFAKELL